MYREKSDGRSGLQSRLAFRLRKPRVYPRDFSFIIALALSTEDLRVAKSLQATFQSGAKHQGQFSLEKKACHILREYFSSCFRCVDYQEIRDIPRECVILNK